MNSPVNKELMDNDYQYIVFEFNMNFSIDSLRKSYYESKKKLKENDNDDILRELGYSDSDILNKHDLT